MTIELRKGILFVDGKQHRWYKIWNYPALIVFSHMLRAEANIIEMFEK